MATSPTPVPPQYQYYQPYAVNAGYNTTSDPRQAAKNLAEFSVNTGGQLLNQQQQLANQYGQEQAATQNYLNPIEGQLAAGGGGYTPDEASQIELSPQQRQDIVTGAGISSGVGTASAVGAAERAAAASGGNPAALATYRQRAAQTQGAEAGDAETKARIEAQQAGSAGAQAVGNARQAQQGQALGYYGNLQAQQGTQQATEQGLGNQSFGTEVGGLSGGTDAGIKASGVPTTGDKIIGGITGALSALADGKPNYLNGDDGGQDAVVAEDGPEAIIPGPADVVRAASDPVRSHTTFMDNGTAGGATTPGGMPPWLQAILAKQPTQQPAAPQPGQPDWNKTTPYNQLGTSIGKAFRPVVQNLMSGTGQGGRTAGAGSGGGFSGLSPQATSETTVDPMNMDDEGGPASYLGGATGAIADAAGDAGSDLADLGASGLADAGSAVASGVSDLAGTLADGRPSYLAGGRMSSGFHWGTSRPHAPHPPAGGYTPLNNNPRMMADGGVPVGPPTDDQYLAWSSPDIKSEIESARRSMVGQAQLEMANRMADPGQRRGMADWAHHDMQQNAGEIAAKTRSLNAYRPTKPSGDGSGPGRGGYPTPHKADGNAPEAPSFNPSSTQTPMQSQSSMQTGNGNRPQIITKPTLVHLEREDMVVPLSYRPKAKVRPSVAMAAMQQPQPGGYRVRA